MKLYRGARAIELGRDATRTEDLVPCYECDAPYDWSTIMDTIALDRV